MSELQRPILLAFIWATQVLPFNIPKLVQLLAECNVDGAGRRPWRKT
jgi:hypothetical protein